MNKLFFVSGSSGAGKTTLVTNIVNENTIQAISHTSRSMRKNEVNGIDYHFVSKFEFECMIAEEQFIECECIHGNYYGTHKDSLNVENHNIIKIINVKGAYNIKMLYPNSNCIFIYAKNDILRQRLISRGDDIEDIEKRLSIVDDELFYMNDYDWIIDNSFSLDISLEKLKLIIK